MQAASQKFFNSSPAESAGTAPGRRVEASASAQPAGQSRPDPEQLRRMLSSPEGQALLRLLQSDGGAGLRTAAEALRKGNVEGVKAALSPLLSGTEAEKLTRSLEAKL